MWQEAVMGGGGSDWYHTIVLTAPLGATINVTDGDEDIDAVGTGNSMAIPVHNPESTYDITINATGFQWTDQITTPAASGTYEYVDIDFGTIELTFDDDFRELDLTVTDSGSNTGTVEAPSTGNTMTIYVPALGTWKVGSEISGYMYWTRDIVISNFNIPKEAVLEMVPIGATATPTDDIQIWLQCAGVKDKTTYSTLSDVLADESTLAKVLTSENATDYLKRSVTWASGITADETAMSYIGALDYAAEELLDDSTWNAAILASTYVDEVLNTSVPVMTSNLAPRGRAFAHTEYGSGNEAYKAFDGDDTGTRYRSTVADTAAYIGYDFGYPVDLQKVEYTSLRDAQNASTPTNITTFNMQGYDGTDRTVVSDTFGGSTLNTGSAKVTTGGVKYNQYILQGLTTYGISVFGLRFKGRAVGGVQSWLKAANISLPYTTIEEVLADHVTLEKLMTNHDAVDYLVTAKNLAPYITADETAMRYIGRRNYAADTLIADECWCKALADSEYFDSVFTILTPAMSSSSSGGYSVSQSSYNSGSIVTQGYCLFDRVGMASGNSPWQADANRAAGSTEWVKINFPTSVKIKAIKLFRGAWQRIRNFYISASNDNWATRDNLVNTVEASSFAPDNANLIFKSLSQDTAYNSVQLALVSAVAGPYIQEMYLLGREDVDESKVILRGASGANIYYKNAGVDVPITTLVGTEAEVLRSNLPSGKATLYSDVADDPDNIGNDFHKDVVIDANTIEIDVMPDNSVYWYGFEGEDLEDMSSANGWTVGASGYSFVSPTYQTNYINCAGSSSKIVGVAGSKKRKFRNYVGHALISGAALVSGIAGRLGSVKTKNNADWSTGPGSVAANATGASLALEHVKLIGRQDEGYLETYTYNTGSYRLNALYANFHNPAANFFGAANDLVYYMSGGVQVPFAVTNDLGEAVVDFSDIPNGTYTLYSSIAKNPSNLSQAFTKDIVVKSDMRYEKFHMMPDGDVLYWYGYISDNCEAVSTANGWSADLRTPSNKNVCSENYITIDNNDSTDKSWTGLGSKTPIQSGSSINMIEQGVNVYNNVYGTLAAYGNKHLANPLGTAGIQNATLSKLSIDASTFSNFYIATVCNHVRAFRCYALWVE